MFLLGIVTFSWHDVPLHRDWKHTGSRSTHWLAISNNLPHTSQRAQNYQRNQRTSWIFYIFSAHHVYGRALCDNPQESSLGRWAHGENLAFWRPRTMELTEVRWEMQNPIKGLPSPEAWGGEGWGGGEGRCWPRCFVRFHIFNQFTSHFSWAP